MFFNHLDAIFLEAIQNGDYFKVQDCLRLGCDPNQSYGPSDPSTLFIAVKHNRPQIAGLLLQHGANLMVKDDQNKSFLLRAIDNHQVALVHFILDYTIRLPASVFCALVAEAHLPALITIILNAQIAAQQQSDSHYENQIKIMEILLRYIDRLPDSFKYDLLNQKNNSAQTAIYLASYFGLAEMTKMLIEAGAAVDVFDMDTRQKDSALLVAIKRQHFNIVKTILSYSQASNKQWHHSIINQKLSDRDSLLTAAIVSGQENIAMYLIEMGISLKAVITEKNAEHNLLFLACRQGLYDVASHILTYLSHWDKKHQESILKIQDAQGRSLFSFAASNSKALLGLLLETALRLGVLALPTQDDGFFSINTNPLIIASEQQDQQILVMLLNYMKQLPLQDICRIFNKSNHPNQYNSVFLRAIYYNKTNTALLLLEFFSQLPVSRILSPAHLSVALEYAQRSCPISFISKLLRHILVARYNIADIRIILKPNDPDFSSRIQTLLKMNLTSAATLLSFHYQSIETHQGLSLISDDDLRKVLIAVCQSGKKEIVDAILKYLQLPLARTAADSIINHKSPETGVTPLFSAILSDHLDVANLLINANASFSDVDPETGHTALTLCTEKGGRDRLLDKMLCLLESKPIQHQKALLLHRNRAGDNLLDLVVQRGMKPHKIFNSMSHQIIGLTCDIERERASEQLLNLRAQHIGPEASSRRSSQDSELASTRRMQQPSARSDFGAITQSSSSSDSTAQPTNLSLQQAEQKFGEAVGLLLLAAGDLLDCEQEISVGQKRTADQAELTFQPPTQRGLHHQSVQFSTGLTENITQLTQQSIQRQIQKRREQR